MTIVAAVKVSLNEGPAVIVGSDSLVTCADDRLINVVSPNKLVRVKNAFVGVCGEGPMSEALEWLTTKRLAKIRTRLDAQRLGIKVYKRVRRQLEKITDSPTTAFGDLLVVTASSIYIVYTD